MDGNVAQETFKVSLDDFIVGRLQVYCIVIDENSEMHYAKCRITLYFLSWDSGPLFTGISFPPTSGMVILRETNLRQDSPLRPV